MSDSELDSEDEEIKISKTYKTTALNSFSTVVLAMLTSGTIVSVLKIAFKLRFNLKKPLEVYFLRDTNTYSCDEKCPDHANCLGVHLDQITKFICQCEPGRLSAVEGN